MNPAMIITAIFISTATPTSYRSVPEQTDSTPFHTSTGERVHNRGVAVSRDLLARWGGPLNYGDLVYIEGIGFKFVNDCMAERHKRRVDIWTETLKEEQDFHKKFKGQIVKVWVVKKVTNAGDRTNSRNKISVLPAANRRHSEKPSR